MAKRINIGPWISTYILHKKYFPPFNKAVVGPGKDSKLTNIEPTSIPESRVIKNEEGSVECWIGQENVSLVVVILLPQ